MVATRIDRRLSYVRFEDGKWRDVEREEDGREVEEREVEEREEEGREVEGREVEGREREVEGREREERERAVDGRDREEEAREEERDEERDEDAEPDRKGSTTHSKPPSGASRFEPTPCLQEERSGNPAGRTMLITSLMTACLTIRSVAVVADMEGEALTSTSQGLRCSSTRTSYP